MNALQGLAEGAAQVAVAWVEQGRYATIEDALEPAILALAERLEAAGSDIPARAVRVHELGGGA